MTDRIGDNGLTAESFAAIAQLAYRESGLQLAVEKTSMIQSRLRHRLRALNISDFENYSAFVCSEDGRTERRHMISALTTNVSHFFREKHHFDVLTAALRQNLLPKLRSGQKVRIWSAGCSNGQEAFSIAMTLLEFSAEIAEFDIRILATDIDANVVRFATEGRYPDRLISGVPDTLLQRYFDKETLNGEVIFSAHKKIRDMVAFKELNLLSNWPMKQQMDIIFCRNVVIYFDLETQNRLWPRFHNILKPDGYLFLGHSERIAEPDDVGFTTSGPTTYRPVAAGLHPSTPLKES
ncbi:CheR family methyltransferase [Roseobacter sinensis]|uniref:Chemotaxis protein methyltransferase n=1 Tax=Roseobacter sinensis TaxID=2931391 RepID=A0ABT3BES6_9RHOB|nr:protein-glutamate O-methyltransferase CheR [Roseobacter sp. WL0113]MCV3272057.1 protein-glutamate O-methyltransferase CheR [Roseobacter sp. WL0113]